jgi:hypothetical protein
MIWPCLSNEGTKVVRKCVALFTVRNKKKKAEKQLYPLLEVDIWKMEAGRTDYCGN